MAAFVRPSVFPAGSLATHWKPPVAGIRDPGGGFFFTQFPLSPSYIAAGGGRSVELAIVRVNAGGGGPAVSVGGGAAVVPAEVGWCAIVPPPSGLVPLPLPSPPPTSFAAPSASTTTPTAAAASTIRRRYHGGPA